MADNMGESPDQGMDIQSILTGTSDTDTTGSASDQSSATSGSASQGQSGGGTGEFRFAGRTFKGGMKDAEKWANQTYGKYSETQQLVNWLKTKGLRDPELLEALSQDPEWSDVLAKLGIEGARESVEREEAEDEAQGAPDVQSALQEIKVANAGLAIDREEMSFERKLGRQVTDEEHDAVMTIIGRAPSLSYAEAFKLAFHDKMLKEAQMKAQASGQQRKGNRPPPIPGVAGTKLDLKKNPRDMNGAEWRENLRQSDEFRNLMSRE